MNWGMLGVIASLGDLEHQQNKVAGLWEARSDGSWTAARFHSREAAVNWMTENGHTVTDENPCILPRMRFPGTPE